MLDVAATNHRGMGTYAASTTIQDSWSGRYVVTEGAEPGHSMLVKMTAIEIPTLAADNSGNVYLG